MNNITVLNFSPRTKGNCAAISRLILDHYAEANVRFYNVCESVSPCSGCNYECLKLGEVCPKLTAEQTAMMDSIRCSDLVYYVIPNFCGMPNAVYHAFNERSVGYFNMDRARMNQYMAVEKRFVIVSNTESTMFVESVRQQTTTDPEILYLKTGRYQKKSIAGDMMESAEAQADLKAFLNRDTDH